MATTHTAHSKKEEEDEKVAEAEKGKKKEPAKPQGQIDSERAKAGEDVTEESEQGKPTDAREWEAADNERKLKAARAQFESEFAAKQAAGK